MSNNLSVNGILMPRSKWSYWAQAQRSPTRKGYSSPTVTRVIWTVDFGVGACAPLITELLTLFNTTYLHHQITDAFKKRKSIQQISLAPSAFKVSSLSNLDLSCVQVVRIAWSIEESDKFGICFNNLTTESTIEIELAFLAVLLPF